VAVSVDGTLLYMACYGSQHLPVFDSETLKLISNPTITGFPENYIAASPDGARLYIAGQNNSSVVFDAKRLQQIGAPLPIPMHRVSVSPDSKRVYMSTGDGTVLCLDSETLKPIDSHWRADGFTSLAVSPDGERLYAATYLGTLHTLDARSLQPIGNPVSPDKNKKVFWDIAVSPTNPHIYVLGEDKLYVFSIVNVSGGRAPA
jgi:DNA-binding beta-propeller fold protein YncE